MEQGYLARESERMNRASRRTVTRLFVVLLVALAIMYVLGKDSLGLDDISFGTIPFYMLILVGIALVCLAIQVFVTRKPAANGSNLYLPYGENTQAAVAEIIDREAREGKILVEEYIDGVRDPKKAAGQKIALLPSYLLIFEIKGGVRGPSITAIPRDKIYWVCAQVGQKGGPFMVRLLVFTEKKMYSMTGVDIEHAERIAAQLYKYMPNVFSDYDPFVVSYQLEEIFAKNPEEFFEIYEAERKKKAQL